jgi:hypothetical protein
MSNPPAASPDREDPYDDFLASVRARFEAVTRAQDKPALFTTETSALFQLYLDALPAELRQEHSCATCRRFFEHYGGLVTVDEAGRAASALWSPSDTPAPFADAASALAEAVTRAPISGVFVSSDEVWGTSPKGGWDHLALTPASELLSTDRTRTAAQVAAEKREDFRMLSAALEEFPLALVKKAAALLSTGGLYRSEKCISVAEWLHAVHRSKKAAGSARACERLVWRAVATAPPGFCHVRSTMIGTLLIDLADELPFETIKARFDGKMHPLQYQRPTAAPSRQNIERAEAMVALLRSAGALERRFATLADVEALWLPAGSGNRGDGDNNKKGRRVFAHIKARAKGSEVKLDAPAVVMTWDKFARTVLPSAARIDYLVPAGNQPYVGLITAMNPDAPPIIQWDSPDRRNPLTWYVYVKGSAPARWNLRPNIHHRVTAITLAPSMWGGDGKHSHHGKKVIFLLEGAKDLEYEKGAGFFPEFLKHEYREIRATLEAYAKDAVVSGKEEASACGLMLSEGGSFGQSFRVTTDDGVTLSYKLDRWD